MDSMTIIAIVSIITAGVTIGLGSIAPALGEGRAVSTALTSLAQQPDAAKHHHTNLVRGPGDDRIHCHLLSRDLDDSDLRQPVLEPRHCQSHRKVSHAYQLVHRRRPGNQLPHPGVVVEAIPLQTHPPRHRRTRERDRHPARGGRGEEGGSAKGTRRLSAQERGLRPGACGAAEKSHGRGQGRTSAAPRRSTKGCRRLACQTPGRVAKRTT